jgi:hypothetical protein
MLANLRKLSIFLSGHFAAGFCASSTGAGAFFHEIFFKLVTVIAAFIADIGAYAAGLRIVGRVSEHKIRVDVADFCTVHKQIDVFGFSVFAAHS